MDNIERKINNGFAYFLMIMAGVTAISLIVELIVHKRFAYWHIPTVAIFYILGKMQIVPKEDPHQKAEDRKF